MNNAEANRPIANRFLEAFDALVAMGKIKSVRSYCDPNGVDRRNMELLRKDPTRNLLQPFWLVPLITEYGVSFCIIHYLRIWYFKKSTSFFKFTR